MHFPFDKSKAVEIGRFAVLPSSRIKAHNRIVAFALTLSATCYSRRVGYDFWLLATSQSLKQQFEKLGGTIVDLEAELLPLHAIDPTAPSWRFYQKRPARYYWLATADIVPNFGQR